MKYAHMMGNSVLYNAEYLEEFAELIVSECVNAVMDGTNAGDHYAQRVEYHFDNGASGVLYYMPEEEYNPYNIGKQLYLNGFGIPDIRGAVKEDSDMEECYLGYLSEMIKDENKFF